MTRERSRVHGDGPLHVGDGVVRVRPRPSTTSVGADRAREVAVVEHCSPLPRTEASSPFCRPVTIGVMPGTVPP